MTDDAGFAEIHGLRSRRVHLREVQARDIGRLIEVFADPDVAVR